MILEIIGIILLNNISFILMFYFCSKIAKNEKIKTPIEYIQEKKELIKEKKEQKIEEANSEIMLENINAYDGTTKGQKDFK